MKRFVTYLYEYENGQKIKNVGFLRVDIRNQMVNMQVSIRYPELENETGNLYIIVRDGSAYRICLGEIQMREGQYHGSFNSRYQAIGESPYSFSDVVGVVISYENGCYLASSWKDEEDEMIARGKFVEYGVTASQNETLSKEITVKEFTMEENSFSTEVQMEKASIELTETDIQESPTHDLMYEEMSDQDTYRKINLNEIATLPSSNWHFSNNSFLIHGFWNYGYLVLKETMEAGEKKFALGIPGIFEQPEMVMATYFGFPIFEALPQQVVEMVVGETYVDSEEEIIKGNNQQPKDGTFGCWFVNL